MRHIFALILLVIGLTSVFAQNEQAPMGEKAFEYKDWTYKNIRADGETNLRGLAKDKKLLMVVYFAPWCPNWRHDAPFVQELYDKYKSSGLEIVAIGEYDPVASMKKNLTDIKADFPAVYESDTRAARASTRHFADRTKTGDTRRWGSPWYVFLEPSLFEKSGDVLTQKENVVNGELKRDEAENFIRAKLGLAATPATVAAGEKAVVVCDPVRSASSLKSPL